MSPLSQVTAQSPVTLDSDDVYFQFTQHSVPQMCGFTIRGNHRSRDNPHTEWDLNIDQITGGGRTIAGISAGAFEVDGRKRIPKPPIVGLAFFIEDDPEPIPARIVGQPNPANGIRAALETDPANKLFKAFSDSDVIKINLEYQGGSSDQLIIRGWHDSERGKNSLFNQCLRGNTPTGNARRIL